ncbi:MAG: uroporphyrinogen-III synthase [Marinilabiliaceae bacterium]|nr:uroporphyrinogen-III synthase [Marinilabiliaceae bacterium]
MTQKPTNIILTHPFDNDDFLSLKAMQEGMNVIADSMIETHQIILSLSEIEEICNSDIVIFTSKRGVKYTLSQMNPMCCHDKKVVVVGQKTALALTDCGIMPSFVSKGQTGKEMCEALIADSIITGKKVTALLAQLADDTIEEYLSKLCDYKRIDVYQTLYKKKHSVDTIKALKSNDSFLVSFTSSSAVKAFVNLYANYFHNSIKCVSIGPVTSKTIEEFGLKVEIEAKESTYEGLFKSIEEYLNINATI